MRSRRVFLLLYLVSGAAALLYEVIWLRLLTLSMGHTPGVVGTVLAAFMGGLAAGAALAGRSAWTRTPTRALRAYAFLEIAIAICALILPFALAATRPLLASAYANGNGAVPFGAVRALISFVLVAIPAAAMGASYPIGVAATRDLGFGIRESGVGLPRAESRGIRPAPSGVEGDSAPRSELEVRRDATSASHSAGALYAANTVGAAFGAALTGFVLLPSLGMFGTTLVGVAFNATAAAGAMLLLRREMSPGTPRTDAANLEAERGEMRVAPPSHLALAAFTLSVSGFVSLVLEVTWTRILAMILGPTTYAFSAMLVAFIAGLAIGSAIATSMVRRLARPGAWLGATMIVVAAAALLAASRVDSLPLTIAATAGQPDASFTTVFALQVALAIATLLPMTIALGATLPFALALAGATEDQMPRAAATIYAMNTAGAIAGALLASFVFVPWLGLQVSIQAVSILAIAAAVLVTWRSPSASLATGALSALAVGIAAAAIVMPPWNHARLANGAYRFAPALAAGDLATGLEAGRLDYYREGAAGTVSVRELLGVRSLAIDGKVDASNRGDMLTQKLLAHLPLLLHPNPHSVFIIGLGSGVTLGAALRHPIDRAVVSEISPEVVAASDAFRTENHDALRDPRTHLIVGDGRTHLQLSDEKYDVIISEPSNPWMAGVSTLFTRQFFAAARSRLAPNGILCQWAHTYNIGDEDLRSIVKTFLEAFPQGTAWLVGESDLLLIGSDAPLTALDEGIAGSWKRPGIAADLAEVQLREPFSLYTLYIGRGGELAGYAGDAPIQNDNRLSLEFSAPRAIYGRFEQQNVNLLEKIATRAQPPAALARARVEAAASDWRDRGRMEALADAPNLAYDAFAQALRINPNDAESLDGLAHAAATAGRLMPAEALLTQLATTIDSAPVQLELATVQAARGEVDAAIRTVQRAAALDPSSHDALQQLVSVLADSGNIEAMKQLAPQLERSAPGAAVTVYCEARLRFMQGQYAAAATLASQLTSLEPDKPWAFALLGSAAANAGQNDRARQAFEAALRLSPRDAAVLLNLGMTELRAGHAQAAADRFSEALFLYPKLAPALDGLAQALDQSGKKDRAAEVRKLIPSR